MSTDGRGLSRAQVRLMQARFGVRATTSADADGMFESHGPAAWNVRRRCLQDGLLAGRTRRLAVRADADSGPTFDLAEGETREKADVKLRRWGTLEGRVVDELGDPIQGAAVQLLHIRYENGRRRPLFLRAARRTPVTISAAIASLCAPTGPIRRERNGR